MQSEVLSLERRHLGLEAGTLRWTRHARELQRRIVDRERVRASQEICQRLAGRHRQIIHGIAEALQTLSAALEAERALREELTNGDVLFLPYVRPLNFISGTLSDPESHASRWMAEAREYNLL